VTPPILDFGERREWLVNIMPWSLCRREREPVPTSEEAKGNNAVLRILTSVILK
jgi:hypothetical protein